MASSDPPDALKKVLPKSPRHYIRNFYQHPNDPTRKYDFYTNGGPPENVDGDEEAGEFLHYIADDDGPLVPQNWGDINVLLFARGCLKTWSVTALQGWALDMFPNLEWIVTAPRDDQKDEVVEKFKQRVEESGLADERVKNAVRHQKFQSVAYDRSTGEKVPAYTHLKSRSAWNEGDALRGLHGHGGTIDESQDVDEGTFSTFMEAIDQAIRENDFFPTIFVIGTPKMANTFFHKLWKMSDMKDWDNDTKEWVAQSTPNEFMPSRLREGVPYTTLLEFEGYSVKGWHVDQPNSPLHKDHRIEFKRETYSEKKFQNEVLAQFYTPENDLIANGDVWNAFDETHRLRKQPTGSQERVVMGVDWGGGEGEGAASTVVSIAEVLPDDSLLFDKIEVFDTDLSKKQERQRIDTYMDQYDVDVCVVDEGYGSANREALQDEYERENVYGCMYGNVKDKDDVKWNRFKSKKRFFTCNRTHMIESMVEDFKDEKMVIPQQGVSFDTSRSLGSMILDQLTAPYTDRKETSGGKKKLKVMSDRNDDIFHSFVYTWLAAEKISSTRSISSIKTHKRKGHT
jgi:hypothetical protein